jgi:hypothetical protein
VNKKTGFIVLIVSLFIVSGVDAGEQDLNRQVQALSTHDITMDASSYQSFPVYCQSGNILSGDFIVKHDGELYPGDQTEYDLSLLTGIDFLILDEENYDLWIRDESATPIFEMKTLVQLTWSVEVPHEGLWYIVYVNDSIYMKRIEGNIVHPGAGDVWLFLFGIIGAVPILGVAYMFWKKRGRAVAA